MTDLAPVVRAAGAFLLPSRGAIFSPVPPEPKHCPEPITVHVAKPRTCLLCRLEFDSAWCGERICERCKDSHDFEQGAGLSDQFL